MVFEVVHASHINDKNYYYSLTGVTIDHVNNHLLTPTIRYDIYAKLLFGK